MKRWMFAFWVAALVVLVPVMGWAGTPYRIEWWMVQENPACEHAYLVDDGDAFFRVNHTPLPTFEVAGAFTVHPDGSESNKAEAEFDSVLLLMGANDFHFQVANAGGHDHCVRSQNVVNLVSGPLGIDKPLFNVRRDGAAFSGSTQLELSLSEINPPLARDIANLEAALEAEREELVAGAAKVEALEEQLSLLRALDEELHELVNRPLDEIAQEDLDAILDRYAGVVDEATRKALEHLLEDLKQSVADLQDELASLMDTFSMQADAVVDLVTGDARATGFNPDDPSNYGLGPGDVPWVEIPDVSNVPGAFEPGKDPYDAYAEAVIGALSADVVGDIVTDRADFVANVRAWRANQKALKEALLAGSGVSQAETSAFLNAQIKVTQFVRKFMDASDWFLESPVPPDVRAAVDGILKQGFDQLADALKDNLNQEDGFTIDLEQTQLFQMVTAFGGAMSTVGDGVTAYVDVMQQIVHASARLGLGFVPYVGPALDFCEAVTGREWCLASGKELSTEERIFSGVGFGIGSVVTVWAGVKNAGITPAGKKVAQGVLSLGDEFALALQGSRRKWYKTLRGAGEKAANEFEAKAGLYLMKTEGRAMIGVGDDGVRKVLGILKPNGSLPKGVAAAPDYLTVTKGNKLAVSEVKGGGQINFGVEGEVVDQLSNALHELKEANLLGDVERVELIVAKGAKFSDNDLTVLDGHLVKISTGERVTLKGFKHFIKVIQL